eukprot:Gb_40372 [translate_table: standard]
MVASTPATAASLEDPRLLAFDPAPVRRLLTAPDDSTSLSRPIRLSKRNIRHTTVLGNPCTCYPTLHGFLLWRPFGRFPPVLTPIHYLVYSNLKQRFTAIGQHSLFSRFQRISSAVTSEFRPCSLQSFNTNSPANNVFTRSTTTFPDLHSLNTVKHVQTPLNMYKSP